MCFNFKRITIFLLAPLVLLAGNYTSSSFEVLRTDFNPRSAAMSNAIIMLQGDASGMMLNPVSSAQIEHRQFYFNYMNYVLDINGGSAGYALPVPGIGVASVNVLYLDYGEFSETDDYAVETGRKFSANDFALAVGLADRMDKYFSYGVSVKYAYSKIHDYSASSIALDFGMIWHVPFEQDLNIAFVANNIGANFEYYAGVKEALPLRMRIGFTKKLAHLPLELGASLNDLNVESKKMLDRVKRFAIGGEFTLSEMLRLRLGYDNALHSSLKMETERSRVSFGGVSGGFGIYWRAWRFDFSYSNLSALGGIPRFGLSGWIN
jgi:hypothetical protein